MVKHTQTICRLLPTNCLSVFHHFVDFVKNWLIRILESWSTNYISILILIKNIPISILSCIQCIHEDSCQIIFKPIDIQLFFLLAPQKDWKVSCQCLSNLLRPLKKIISIFQFPKVFTRQGLACKVWVDFIDSLYSECWFFCWLILW